jgi:DNA-binding CsgD family transcriptional regulator
MLTAVGDFSSASAVLGRYQADLETSTDPLRAARTRVARADLHLAAGHIDDAATEAEGARGAFETFGASLFTAGAEFTLARAELVRGDVDRASAHLVGMKAALRDGGATSRANASCAWLEAQLVGERDGPAATVQSVAWLYDSLSDHKPLLMSESHAAVWLVRTAQDAGDVRRAEKVIAFSDALAADNPDVEQLAAIACHARGLLDLDDDKLRCAASGYRWPWSAASASEDTGLALGRRDPGAARLWFERALRGFEAIGATGDAKRVRQRLQRIGRRRSRRVERKVSGWASLTETEQEVVGYVADGMTNRQVAARMYLSRHTVDFHLRGIFRKLAVGSRVELTRLVLQRSAMVDGGA